MLVDSLDVARALALVERLSRADDEDVPAVVTAGLGQLLGCAVVTYDEIGPHGGVQRATFGRAGPLAVTPHWTALTVAGPADTVVGITLGRAVAFSEPERELVGLLRPSLAARVARRPDRPAGLTAREWQVVRLAAAGRTDRAIGHLVGCSRRTVGKHLQNAYRKLGVTNRTSAAARLGATARSPAAGAAMDAADTATAGSADAPDAVVAPSDAPDAVVAPSDAPDAVVAPSPGIEPR